jgi:hypothetical protein
MAQLDFDNHVMAARDNLTAGNLSRTLLVSCLVAGMLWYLAGNFARIGKGTDFPDFYAAAKIVRDGQGKQLYDPATQAAYQARYVGRRGSFYLHPPYEVLLYLPFTLFPLQWAYVLWSLVSLVLLSACARLIQPLIHRPWSWQLWLACCVLFPPVLLCLLQGQDSIVLLLILLLMLRAFRQQHNFAAGCLLACGLFKFHLVLPLALIFAIARRSKFVAGFVSTALLLVLVSLGISGWSSLTAYPRFLFHLSELPMPGNNPAGMANLRGLVEGLAAWSHPTRLLLIGIGSLLILLTAAWKASRTDATTILISATAITSAILVSYHLSPHDLVLLLIPLAVMVDLLVRSQVPARSRIFAITLIAMLTLPPLHILLLSRHLYFLFAIPIIGAMWFLCATRNRTPSIPTR